MACPNDLSLARLGVIVAKRHVKNAVRRNLIKRLIRESFRLNQEALSGFDLVVLAREGLKKDVSRQDLIRYLRRHWQDLVSSREPLA